MGAPAARALGSVWIRLCHGLLITPRGVERTQRLNIVARVGRGKVRWWSKGKDLGTESARVTVKFQGPALDTNDKLHFNIFFQTAVSNP